MSSDLYSLLNSARREAQNRNIAHAEKTYLKVIEGIEKKIRSLDFRKMELWTIELWVTKAELLYYKSINPLKGESFKDCLQKRLDCLRYMYKCTKVNDYYHSIYFPRLKEEIKDTILRFGCILPESGNQVVVTCPIYLRRLDRDSEIPWHSLGTSVAMTYDKTSCSICQRDMLDDQCDHVPGEMYDGKQCIILIDKFDIKHVALVSRPKDPQAALFSSYSYSVAEGLDRLSEEDRTRKIKEGLPFVCFLCRDEKLDSSELSPEHFFKMQNLEIEIE